MKLRPILILLILFASILGSPTTILAQAKKPNILVMWGDDIGITDVSAYSDGLMGFETPNIDRVGKEGVIRFSFNIMGNSRVPLAARRFSLVNTLFVADLARWGSLARQMGMSQLDPSIGGLLKSLGYATGQFGKNHVGDRNESLPTVNGFDEFLDCFPSAIQ